ncbi:MAG TPA: hypothetical protein VMM12_06360, partial [Longimicrobiales bacterium]|nr:hypothetical protein [Longimicrobiales bacterium]
GRQVVYSAIVTTSQNIQKAAFDPATGALSDFVWLTSGTRRWANADPTADGSRVTLYSQDRPEGDLYVIRGDGSGLAQQLTSDSAIDRVPRWSPDGSRILYFSSRSGAHEVWTIHPDGSDNRQVTFTSGTGIAAWSPDGSRIAASAPGGVAILDPSRPWDAQEVEWLPVDSAMGRFTVNDWSPDGSTLAGTIDYGHTPGIVLYSLDTRTYERVTDFGEWPVWLPDSRRILFGSGGPGFQLLDTRTGDVGQVYSSDWDIIGPPRLTRDARQVFYSRRVTDGDVWLVTLR